MGKLNNEQCISRLTKEYKRDERASDEFLLTSPLTQHTAFFTRGTGR